MDYSVHDVYPLPEVYGQQLRVLVPNCKPICCDGSPTHSTKSQKLIKTRKKKGKWEESCEIKANR